MWVIFIHGSVNELIDELLLHVLLIKLEKVLHQLIENVEVLTEKLLRLHLLEKNYVIKEILQLLDFEMDVMYGNVNELIDDMPVIVLLIMQNK